MTGETVSRDDLQRKVAEWCAAAFGAREASSVPQRGIRMLEEAVELYQACGGSWGMAHEMIDYVFSRPVGSIQQELGGVGVTVLALAAATGFNAGECEGAEVTRVLSKPLEHFAQRNSAKNDAGFNTTFEVHP